MAAGDPRPGPLARTVARAVGLATGTQPAQVFLTLGRDRRLFRAWLPLAGTLLLRSALPRRDVEFVILRTACNCSSWYEWVEHVPLARRAGVPSAMIAAAAGDLQPQELATRDRLLLTGTDELHRGGISRETVTALRAYLDDRQVIELCMLVGHYEMLAMTLRTMDVHPEPSALAKLETYERAIAEALAA